MTSDGVVTSVVTVAATFISLIMYGLWGKAIETSLRRAWPRAAGLLLKLTFPLLVLSVAVASLVWQLLASLLPWIFLGIGLFLVGQAIWYRILRVPRITIDTYRWAATSVVLHDTLEGLETNAGGYIPKEYERMYAEMDGIRGKVVQIGENGFIRYWKPLPLAQGTITLCVKFPQPDQFIAGIILSTGNWEEEPMPDLYLKVDTDWHLKLAYKRHLGDSSGDWVDITHDTALGPQRWYEVGMTWGPKGMKLAVTDIEGRKKREIISDTNFRQPIFPYATHFGIGRICPKEVAAHNLLLSALSVTDIQEF